MALNWLDIVPLLVSVVLGGIIGLERELRGKAAGLRTNILICLGSCLFTVISTNLSGSEPGRIAAQIVTGIGFLGAGAIIHSGIGIHGLTTAAGIWVVASIGMACGTKMYPLAISTAVLTLIVLLLLPPVEKKISKGRNDEAQ
ncbi:MAG: MgtC/SapB family protein [Planctomycetes bacterium]|nr:MgtC/SapB family protein [Planctomycetota bacterium]MBU1518449.1 MgtC/SapB family protein [Planctomycetota bacterium]MBU2458033.1 MgtC/SapB family protein [Planctomycetota bacterium]